MAYTILYENQTLASNLSKDECFDRLEDLAQEYYKDKKWDPSKIGVRWTPDELSTDGGPVPDQGL
jgi:hypothetical protein